MKLSFINDSYIQRGNNGTHSGGVYKEVSGKLLTYRLLEKVKSKIGVFTVIYLENNGLVGQNLKKTQMHILVLIMLHQHIFCVYRNDPKVLDRYAWANSADPDQTAPRGAV